MKIGIISDTHDQTLRIKKAVEIFNQKAVGLVVHCGDLVSPFTLQFYQELKSPIKFLFGNNTGDVVWHPVCAAKAGLRDYEFSTFYSLMIDGKRIAVYHGERPEITSALIKCGEYDCLFTGHDHLARVEQYGQVLLINPGTLTDHYEEGMIPPSIALYDTAKHSAEIISV